MCGSYGFSFKEPGQVYERFDITNTLERFNPRFNVRPGQKNPVITSHSPNKISNMLWGLIPAHSKEKNIKFSTFNARAETVATTWSYRDSFKHRRAIIPASFFYEPNKVGKKNPPFDWFYFGLKNSELFGMAGLYDIWKDIETGEEIFSYTIITTMPNEIVGKVHTRMPVILKKEDERKWLDSKFSDTDDLLSLLQPYASSEMEGWLVGNEVKSYKNDSPDLINPKVKTLKNPSTFL